MLDNKLLLGKPVADMLTNNMIDSVKALNDKGYFPKLVMVKVGNRSDDSAYEKGIVSICKKCGILAETINLDINCTQEEYISTLESFNTDNSVHGILCFRPLPDNIDEEVVKYHINDKKDVDCFSPVNLTKIISGDKTGFPPCTPMGVIEILKYYDVDLIGKNVTVLGRSMVVGKPLSMLLLNRDSTVTICHSKSKDLKKISKNSDIVVYCIGSAKMINKDYIKKDAVVIDVGINFDQEGNICGDVDFDDVFEDVSKITPVPKGVGAVTTSVLARHVIKACLQINNI